MTSLRGKLLIVFGGIVVLGLAFALWRLTRDISTVEAADPRPRATPTEAPRPDAAETTASGSPNRDARIAPVTVTRPRPTQAPSGSGPVLEAAGSGSAEANLPPGRLTERELKRQLIKQLDGLDGPVSDCVAKSTKSGIKPTGAAALTLKIERIKTGGAAVVEVAVEPIDTTVKDPALLECLRDTGRRVVLDLPEGVTEVTATHQVNLDAGGITGHDLTAYDFKPGGRPVDPPTPAPTPKP